MLTQEVIKPATIKWAPPFLFVSKTDAILRFFVDYRRLNAETPRGFYATLRMDDCIESHGERTVNSTLDAKNGY